MKVWKLFFIYTRGKGKNPFFHFSGFPVFAKILKKEYNIRFKIYPSPFTSPPHPSFHIFVIGFPTFVFWIYPSEIFCYLSEIFFYSSEIFRYLSELFFILRRYSAIFRSYFLILRRYSSEWFHDIFRTLFPESTQIAQIA